MLIHVMPGEIPGNPLALTNELHALRYRRGVTALVDAGDGTPATLLAREWACRCNIPTVSRQRPDLLIIPIDMDNDFGSYEGSAKAWAKTLSHIQPPRPGLLRRLLGTVRYRDTLWVNTTHADYRIPT